MFTLQSKETQPESAAHQYDMLDFCERAALAIVARLARCQLIGWRANIEERGLGDTVDVIADEIRMVFKDADGDDLADFMRWGGLKTDVQEIRVDLLGSLAQMTPNEQNTLLEMLEAIKRGRAVMAAEEAAKASTDQNTTTE